MAIMDGRYIRGAVGNTVFKKVGKKQVLQSKVKKAKMAQTEATKKSASVFGKASKLASYVRVALNQIIGFYDNNMASRLTGEMNYCFTGALVKETQKFEFHAESFSRLNGFEFNNASLVKNQFFVQPEVVVSGGIVQINLPEMHIPQDLKIPKNGRYCILGFQVALFDLKHKRYNKLDVQTTEIKYDFEPLTVAAQQFSFDVSPGCLCIVGLTFQYFEKTFAGNAVINDQNFNPAAILKAFMIAGVPDKAVTAKWQEM